MSPRAAVCVLLLAGCRPAPETATVRGRVTAGGTPVPAGSVLLSADRPKWATVALISADGEFEATGVPVGTVKVGVRTRGVKRFDPAGEDADPVRTPRSYEDPASSGLEYAVGPGEHVVEIALPAD